MTRAIVIALAWCGAASLAAAQQPAENPDDFETGEIGLAVGQTDSDTSSSKFEEYRDFPNGFGVPSFRFRGLKDGFHWDFSGRDVREKDQQFWLDLSKGAFSIEGDYNQIPHSFGNDGHTLL